MSIKAALFACVIAAGVGCRGDHSSEDNGYGRPVESTDPSLNTTHSNEAGHTVHDRSDVTNENTGADVSTGRQARPSTLPGRRTATPTQGTAPAPQPTNGFSMGMGTQYSGTGLDETTSGNGTTTNTGTDTENAGNGNTDNPNQ